MSKSLGSIRNITPFSGGTPTYHLRPQLPVVQHTSPTLLQSRRYIRHLHASDASQFEGLYVPESLLQLDDASFDAIPFLGKDSEAVDLRYDRLVSQVFGAFIDCRLVSVSSCKDVQVFLGVNGSSCEGEEGGGVERSGIDEIGLVYNT